jgi:hypothetical protein
VSITKKKYLNFFWWKDICEFIQPNLFFFCKKKSSYILCVVGGIVGGVWYILFKIHTFGEFIQPNVLLPNTRYEAHKVSYIFGAKQYFLKINLPTSHVSFKPSKNLVLLLIYERKTSVNTNWVFKKFGKRLPKFCDIKI